MISLKALAKPLDLALVGGELAGMTVALIALFSTVIAQGMATKRWDRFE